MQVEDNPPLFEVLNFYNPLLRTFPGFNEDISLGKAFHLTLRLTTD